MKWGDLRRGFYLAFAAFGIVYSIASFGTDGLLTLFLSETKAVEASGLGTFGVARGLGALLGAVLLSLISRRKGLLKAQYMALSALVLGCLLPLLPLPVLLVGLLWGVCWGLQETAYVTLSMRFAQGAWSATFFAMAMIFSNVGTSLGEALGSPLVPKIGYSGVFLGFAAVAALSAVFVPKAFSRFREHASAI